MNLGSARWPLLGMLMLPLAWLASCAAPTAQAPATEHAVDCAVERCVALTFDDGPGPFTDRLLDDLAKTKTPATFFLMGQNVEKYSQTVQRMAEEGHQLGNHTWDHSDMNDLSIEEISEQLKRTDTAIMQAAGRGPTVFRPPYGHYMEQQLSTINHPVILWDVNSTDTQHSDPKQTIRVSMENVKPGSIILMHDVRESTVEAIPELITALKAEGFKLVTVEQLFNGSLRDSQVYSSAPQPNPER